MTTNSVNRPGRRRIWRLPPFRVEAQIAASELRETIDWGLAALNVPPHWKATQGEGVRVALLDTGIDESHPDLNGAIDDVRDFTGSRAGAADRNGHGTHTAGIVAARKNERGVVGVSPECRLLIGKVLDDAGAGSTASVAAGIDWACDQGADVINLSLGSPYRDAALQQVVERAAAKGKFLIAAAGNDGARGGVNFPARWEETIAVAAIDRQGSPCAFSSAGPEVDFAAPGQEVMSTYLGHGYARLSGTSMAAPFVSGLVALLIALHRRGGASKTPLRTIDDLIDHLRRAARDTGPVGHDPATGWGLVDADRLLDLSPISEPGAPPPHVSLPDSPQPGGICVVLSGLTWKGERGELLFRPLA